MLSDEQWQKIADKTGCFITGGLKEAIEAEVRKQDTALIRQLVDALDTAFHQTCSVGRPKDWEQIRNALHSARARLEDAK